MEATRVIKYNDLQSTLALWLKVFTLAPFWFFPAVPFIGLLFSPFGWAFSQMAFFCVILWAASYFVEDLLKRKLSLRNEILYFGYKQFPLNEIEAAGLKYGKNKVLPSHLVLRFKQGKQLKLKLNRLSIVDVDFLIRHIENNYKSCKIDPVVTSLSVLRTTAKKNLTATSDRLEIPYASHRPLKELVATFVATAAGWTRFGPLICVAFFGTWGIGIMGLLFRAMMNPKLTSFHQNDVADFFTNMNSTLTRELSKGFSSAGSELAKMSANPLGAAISIVGIICIFYYLLRVLLKPNLLVVTPQYMDKNLTVGGMSLTLDRLDWKNVVHAALIAPSKNSNNASKIIRLERLNQKPFDLILDSLDQEDRQLLNQRLKAYAPDATHDANFDEAMLTRQKSSYTELWLQSLTAPPKRASVKPLIPGEFLRDGQFEVIGRLGLGGQGTAYLCSENGKKVVLKETILPTFVDQSARQHALSRFEQEARLLNEMDHPQIVKLTDYFIEDHRSYLVLEHIDGGNLKQAVEQKGRMSEEEVRAFALQMCDMLEYLHALNVVHRDFTPDNLMLTQSGLIKLIDFNVAKNEEVGITATVVGKHAYIPPEQFRGKPTHQSDLYAMGATLSYLLTGSEPTPITQSNPQKENENVSDDLNSIIKDLTHLSENKRPASIQIVRERLLGKAQTADFGKTEDLAPSQENKTISESDTSETISLKEKSEKITLPKEKEKVSLELGTDG